MWADLLVRVTMRASYDACELRCELRCVRLRFECAAASVSVDMGTPSETTTSTWMADGRNR